jgi:hypothetical protein
MPCFRGCLLIGLERNAFLITRKALIIKVQNERDLNQLYKHSEKPEDFVLPQRYETIVVSPSCQRNIERLNVEPFLLGSLENRLCFFKNFHEFALFYGFLEACLLDTLFLQPQNCAWLA